MSQLQEVLDEYTEMFRARGEGPRSAQKLARLTIKREFEKADVKPPKFPPMDTV